MQRSNFRGQPVKRASVYLPDELHADELNEILREFAANKNASPATIILAAIEDTYEDETDAIAGEIARAKYLVDPSSGISERLPRSETRKTGHLT